MRVLTKSWWRVPTIKDSWQLRSQKILAKSNWVLTIKNECPSNQKMHESWRPQILRVSPYIIVNLHLRLKVHWAHAKCGLPSWHCAVANRILLMLNPAPEVGWVCAYTPQIPLPSNWPPDLYPLFTFLFPGQMALPDVRLHWRKFPL